MDIGPIKNEADYDRALQEIDELFGAEPGSPEGDRLEVLVTLVEAYEARHYEIPDPNPIAAVEHAMERLGLTPKDLEQYIGSRARVWEVLNRKRRLTLPMIRKLEQGLNIPASVLVKDYELADELPHHTVMRGG